MPSILIILQAGSAAIALIVVLAGAFIILRSTLARTTSDLWRQEADALKVRLETVELAEEQCKERLKRVETANQVLSDQVTGTAAITLLSEKMDRFHLAVMTLLERRTDGR